MFQVRIAFPANELPTVRRERLIAFSEQHCGDVRSTFLSPVAKAGRLF